MTIGDRVRLHIDPGYCDILELPTSIGVVADFDLSTSNGFVLIHFDDMAVYLSPLKEEQVEVLAKG